MRIEHLNRWLNEDKSLGLQLKITDPEYIGWILINKREFNPKISSLHSLEQNSPIYREQLQNKETPYFILICELRKEVFDSANYAINEDYRKKEAHRFKSIEEMLKFLNLIGYSIDDIKWFTEIQAE